MFENLKAGDDVAVIIGPPESMDIRIRTVESVSDRWIKVDGKDYDRHTGKRPPPRHEFASLLKPVNVLGELLAVIKGNDDD